MSLMLYGIGGIIVILLFELLKLHLAYTKLKKVIFTDILWEDKLSVKQEYVNFSANNITGSVFDNGDILINGHILHQDISYLFPNIEFLRLQYVNHCLNNYYSYKINQSWKKEN